MPETPTPGAVAFWAYVDAVERQPMPPGVRHRMWARLMPDEQRAWEAAACAVPGPEHLVVDRAFLAHLLACMANQKFLHEIQGSLDEAGRTQYQEMQATIDQAWRDGIALLHPEETRQASPPLATP